MATSDGNDHSQAVGVPTAPGVTAFYSCLLDPDNASELSSFMNDPETYVDAGVGCASQLTAANKAVVLSMDGSRIRWAMNEEGNPPKTSNLASRALMKRVDP